MDVELPNTLHHHIKITGSDNFEENYDEHYYDYHAVAKRYHELPDIFEKVKQTIKKYDTGVNTIEIHDKSDESGNVYYNPVFIHENSKGEKLPLLFEMESKGTQTLFRILLNFFITLHIGSVLVLDEMDEYLDPEILPHLLNFYITEKENPAGGFKKAEQNMTTKIIVMLSLIENLG